MSGLGLQLADWRLRGFDVGQGEAEQAFDAALDDLDWIPATAPGDTYLILHAADLLADPFSSEAAEAACAWVEDREWWWRADFQAGPPGPGSRLILDFEGLDTFATVWLNGEKLGSTDNMFRAWTFDIGAKVKPGLNRLAVAFTPPRIATAHLDGPTWPIGGAITTSRRNVMRKAQFGWGWDWGPTLPTVGIWKPVWLRVEAQAVLDEVTFTTLSLSGDRSSARIAIAVTAEALSATAALSAQIELSRPDGKAIVQRTLALTDGRALLEFDLPDPALWWTPELGAPDRHTLRVTLLAGGIPADHRTLKVGVRTIAIDRSPDPDEPNTEFFRFVINGVPIFAKGTCWIPASSFVASVGREHYRRLLEPALAANMNMIRVWGGGVYEHDPFYDLCDELGLLVWQDFMFACAPYPDTPGFAANVRAEAVHQVKRLRHHPSLAVWCGNNENETIQDLVNMMTGAGVEAPLPGRALYEELLPEVCAALDPTTPYWPGSPYGAPAPGAANSMAMGDVHDWTVWHGMPPTPYDRAVGGLDRTPEGVAYTRYAENMSRFVSEYGIQASPVMETLNRAIDPEERAYDGDALQHRIKDQPKNKIDGMLVTVTGLPTTLSDYVDFSQITQAEGLKFGIEHFRRRMPHCSGSLIWQHNDCWPGISWSLLDYYGFAKAGFFYVARAYAPVMASFKMVEGDGAELWIVNDTLSSLEGEADLALQSFTGEVAWSETIAWRVGPNESRRVWRGEARGGANQALTVRSPAFPPNRYLFVPIKDLDRPAPPAPAVVAHRVDDHLLSLTITAAHYLYFVHLLVPDEATRFSDNYFDLAAGETATILVSHPTRALTPADVTVRWR